MLHAEQKFILDDQALIAITRRFQSRDIGKIRDIDVSPRQGPRTDVEVTFRQWSGNIPSFSFCTSFIHYDLDVYRFRRMRLLWLALLLLSPAIRAAVLAIDYGAEFTKLSLVKPGVPLDVILDRDSKRKVQSVVGWKREDRVFGAEAKMSVSLSARRSSVARWSCCADYIPKGY